MAQADECRVHRFDPRQPHHGGEIGSLFHELGRSHYDVTITMNVCSANPSPPQDVNLTVICAVPVMAGV